MLSWSIYRLTLLHLASFLSMYKNLIVSETAFLPHQICLKAPMGSKIIKVKINMQKCTRIHYMII